MLGSSTPAGTPPQALRDDASAPLTVTRKATHDQDTFGAQCPSLDARCLRFVVRITPPCTQDSLPAAGRLYRVGFGYPQGSAKGFRDIISYIGFPFPRLGLAQDISVRATAAARTAGSPWGLLPRAPTNPDVPN